MPELQAQACRHDLESWPGRPDQVLVLAQLADAAAVGKLRFPHQAKLPLVVAGVLRLHLVYLTPSEQAAELAAVEILRWVPRHVVSMKTTWSLAAMVLTRGEWQQLLEKLQVDVPAAAARASQRAGGSQLLPIDQHLDALQRLHLHPTNLGPTAAQNKHLATATALGHHEESPGPMPLQVLVHQDHLVRLRKLLALVDQHPGGTLESTQAPRCARSYLLAPRPAGGRAKSEL